MSSTGISKCSTMAMPQACRDSFVASSTTVAGSVTNRELIDAALDCLRPYRRDDGTKFGNVSSAIASSTGRIYQGGNLFTPEGAAGICAEKIAFGAMATAGEYEPAKVVALWRPRTGDDVHIVPRTVRRCR